MANWLKVIATSAIIIVLASCGGGGGSGGDGETPATSDCVLGSSKIGSCSIQ